jgi:DNA-binding GntR family transcriptional regulator
VLRVKTIRKPVAATAQVAVDDGSAVERACARLRHLVTQGRLVGGQALIETELSSLLGVARSTVREALRRLQSDGLVTARARGVQVRRLSRRDVADLYVIRESLEGLAARCAASRSACGSALDPRRIEAERRIWHAATSEYLVAAFSEQNRRFHDLIVDASGNAHLSRMLDQTLLLLFASQFRAWMQTPSIRAAAADHLRILEAIERGDTTAAERTMRLHIRHSSKAVLDLPDDAFA